MKDPPQKNAPRNSIVMSLDMHGIWHLYRSSRKVLKSLSHRHAAVRKTSYYFVLAPLHAQVAWTTAWTAPFPGPG